MKNRQLQKGTVVMGTGDLRPWMNVLDKIHEKSQWVVCIDQSVDDRLIRDSSSGDSSKKREIIGFGTGVGVSGEENYTISTEHHSLSDIELKLRESIKQRIRDPKWTEEDYKSVSERIMRVASNISGLSLVRATGVVDEHIRDLMAYSLTRKLVGRDNTLLCDELITLDAYSHWFGFAESMKKPDILWLKADVESDHRLRLDLHLIECKMSEDPKPMMKKAREQVDNGLKVLVDAFKPIDRNAKELDDDKPDRRYWWMQLHRLIAARAKIDKAGDMSKVISALEKLAEGDYEISWEASVMAFWTEAEFDNIFKAGCWENDNLCSGKANVYSIGVNHIRSIAQSNDDGMLKELTDAPLEDEDNIMPIAEELDLIEDLDDEEYRAESPAAEMDDDEYIDDEDEIDSVPSFGVDISSEIQQPEITEDVAISVGFPQRILLGKADTGKDVYWEFGHKDLANRHMVIFGTSGMGKTYAIQCILCELARQNQNSLVIDYTDGFTPSNIEPAAKHFITDAAQEYIYNEPLPINPFKAQVSEEGGQKFNDKPLTIAKRVSSIFKNVYELGTQQLPLTIEVIEKGVDKYGDDFNLEKMLDMLHGYLDHELYTKNTVSTTITKLRPFISSRPFLVDKSEYGWHELFADSVNRCRIFQFHKVDKHSSRAIIEFVLWDLYNYVSSYGGKDKPKVIVLDEIQNLALDEDAPVAKYLTEGRKHGLCLITATQTVKGVGGVSDAKVSRLFQAETKLFFKPTENEMREHAQLLHNAIGSIPVAEWRNRLAKLKKGECWILGRHLVERTGELKLMANKVRISSLEERGFGV
jgi:DNA phosphorothioation-dependent restriction protein DptH